MKDLIAARYVPLRTLGEGAESRVQLVRDQLVGGGLAAGDAGRRLALKSLPRSLAARALLEFRRLASFEHPGIPRVDEFGFDPHSRDCFFTCEYLEGADFVAALGELPLDDQLEAVAQLLRTLQLVHDRGLLHRDLKPANVLVRRSERELHVSLIDFGLADDQVERRVVGSLPYMAPELFDGQQATPATDLYALGVMLFELWTGETPFQANSALEWIRAHREAPIEFPDDSVVPPSLGRLVRRLLAKDPEERYGAASAVLTDLSRISVRSLPRETVRSLAGRIRSPPVAEFCTQVEGGEELDWSERPLVWAVASTAAARAALARELRASMAERGISPIHVCLQQMDPMTMLREQVAALGLVVGDSSGNLEDLLRTLTGTAIGFCIDDLHRRLTEHDPWLRRLCATDAPMIVLADTGPADHAIAAEIERSRRPIRVVRAQPWSLERLRTVFPRWVGAALPEELEPLLEFGGERRSRVGAGRRDAVAASRVRCPRGIGHRGSLSLGPGRPRCRERPARGAAAPLGVAAHG